MQRIVLCPHCHVRAEKDDLGELICPKCNARLCPEAHIIGPYSRWCPQCRWEDPNYFKWREAQKAKTAQQQIVHPEYRPQSFVSQQSSGLHKTETKYTCPQCGTEINTLFEPCPNCNYLFGNVPPQKIQQAKFTEPARSDTARPFLDEAPLPTSKKQSTARQRSPLLDEIEYNKPRAWGLLSSTRRTLDKIISATPREWKPSSARRFLRPVLASLLIIGLGASIYMVVTNTILPALSQQGNEVSSSTPSTSIFAPAQTYSISTSAIPAGGGSILRSPDNETYESGTPVTLTAIPASGYIFDGWDSAPGSLPTIEITMNSDKHVTAYFKLQDTTPPEILEVNVSNPTDISATITWETDEVTTSQVEYWTTSDEEPTPTPLDEELTTSHSVRLTGLESSTTYYFRIKSADGSGNEATSDTETFKTLRAISFGHEAGKRAPLFTLQYYNDDTQRSTPNDGSSVALSDFRGKKVLLNFWSTYCGACILEFPFIRAMYYEHGENSEDLAVITICTDGRADRIKRVEDKFGDVCGPLDFPILLEDEETTTKANYHVWRIPYTVFIDSDGIIRETKIGRFSSQAEIESILKSL